MKKRIFLITGIATALVVAGTLTGVGIYINNQNSTEVTLKIMESNTSNIMIEGANNVRSNGGQSIMIRGKTEYSKILVDIGSTYYSENLTLKNITEEYNSVIDTLILTSITEEYNGGVRSFFESTRYPLPRVKTFYYPGYKVEGDDTSDYIEKILIPKLKAQGTTICTAKDAIDGNGYCESVFNLSKNYELQILDTRQYTSEYLTVADDENIFDKKQEHNMILSINDKSDSSYIMMDGGLDETSMKKFNSIYKGLNGKIKAWILSNQRFSTYINTEFYFGFKPKTAIFTSSSYSLPPTSIYNRMTIEEFKALLNTCKKRIYTPLTMGTMTISLKTSKDMSIRGSEITMYNAINNTENEPFIYSDIVRRNKQLCTAIQEILGIDVSYK